MSLSRREQAELKFHQRQAKVLTNRLSKMRATAEKLLAKKTAEYQADLDATQAAIAELEARQ